MNDCLRVSVDLPLDPSATFDLVAGELATALEVHSIELAAGPSGRITERGVPVGQITGWEPGRRMTVRWHPASWSPGDGVDLVLKVEPEEGGSRITLEVAGWSRIISDPGERGGWFAGEVLAPILRASAPRAFGDWLTDRLARRPSGAQARAIYADPLYHYPNFRVILSELALTRDDYLLEVGCGGGALLKAALERGCRAAAIDHSPGMVRLARQVNAPAWRDGRLLVVEASANALPFAAATFTCAVMTGVLGFLREPVPALADIRRVLRSGGRFVGLGSDPELQGTPGAPEPMASRLMFYDDAGLERLAREAGFQDVRVLRRDLEPYAREAGVPDEHLPLFAAGPGGGARFLVCQA